MINAFPAIISALERNLPRRSCYRGHVEITMTLCHDATHLSKKFSSIVPPLYITSKNVYKNDYCCPALHFVITFIYEMKPRHPGLEFRWHIKHFCITAKKEKIVRFYAFYMWDIATYIHIYVRKYIFFYPWGEYDQNWIYEATGGATSMPKINAFCKIICSAVKPVS